MSLPRPIGGTRQTPGLQSQSAIPAWWRWVCRRSRCKVFPRLFAWEWLRVPTSFLTAERTIRRTGTSRSAAARFISPSVSLATAKKSGAAPWHWRGSSITDFPAFTVLDAQDFGAQPGDLNPLGYKDSIGQPAIEGSGVDPLPGQGRPIKAGEFILGYPGEAGVPLAMLLAGRARAQRHLHRRTQVPNAGRSVQPIPARQCVKPTKNVSCWRRSSLAVGAAARH